MRGGAVGRVLSQLFSGSNVSCGVRGHRVMLCGRTAPRMRTIGRRGSVGNVMTSRRNRPVVNTDMLRGNAAGNAVASLSNHFALSVNGKARLVISCMNCAAGAIGVNGRSAVGVMLVRSAGALSRIIMVNCNARGGSSISNSMASMSNSGLSGVPATGTRVTLRNVTPNLSMGFNDNTTNSSTALRMHNIAS